LQCNNYNLLITLTSTEAGNSKHVVTCRCMATRRLQRAAVQERAQHFHWWNLLEYV